LGLGVLFEERDSYLYMLLLNELNIRAENGAKILSFWWNILYSGRIIDRNGGE
jgi:fucose permease